MAYVYLVRNGDLHKIGRTDNLERRLKQLQPCTVVQTLETDRSRDLEYELHNRYKSKRLPQTEYFRLTDADVDAVRAALGWVAPAPTPEPTPKPKPAAKPEPGMCHDPEFRDKMLEIYRRRERQALSEFQSRNSSPDSA